MYVLCAWQVLPRVLQRKILAALPVELGQYLTDAKQGVHVAGMSPSSPILTLNTIVIKYPLHVFHVWYLVGLAPSALEADIEPF